jgi:hypothetical protein
MLIRPFSLARMDMDQEMIEKSMAETVLDFAAAKDVYVNGKNGPSSFQKLAYALGDSASANALPIFKVSFSFGTKCHQDGFHGLTEDSNANAGTQSCSLSLILN